MEKTEKLKTIQCCYCHSITLMIPCRFKMRQLCIDCERRIEDRARKAEGDDTLVYLSDLVLAWKNEAIKRGYSSLIRLPWEDSNGKYTRKVDLPDRWTLLKSENESLKKEIETLKQ